jgi:hypothetical protein
LFYRGRGEGERAPWGEEGALAASRPLMADVFSIYGERGNGGEEWGETRSFLVQGKARRRGLGWARGWLDRGGCAALRAVRTIRPKA